MRLGRRDTSICIASAPNGILGPLFQEVSRTVRIPASPDKAWSVLLDFPRVASWLKVVHDLREIEPKRRYETMLEDRVGPFAMRADLAIDVRVDDATRTLHVSGAGEDRQIASRISAALDVRVAPEDAGASVDVKGRYEITGRVATLGAAEGFNVRGHDVVHAIFEDAAGDVWVGSSSGLGRIRNGRYVSIGREHGLLGGQVWSVVVDAQDRIWLSVDRGLIHLGRQEFENAVAQPDYRVQYRLYDALDGLAGGAFGHVSAATAADGSLWFIQGGGLTRVNPRDIREDFASIVAPVYIESLLTSNERLTAPAGAVSLPHGVGRLQINYTAVMLSAPNKLRFRYQLRGVDPTWVDAGTQRVAVYTNLSPGNYRFDVEASAEQGIWNTSKAGLAFTIQPAFYQTRWFYALSLAAVLAAIWAMWRVRIGRVKREFSLVLAERVRLSRELHDTLLQSLVGVVLQLEPIAKTVVLEPLLARNQINRVRRQVEAYVREARESIKNLRSPLLKARSLATALEEFGREAVAHTSTTFTMSVAGEAALPQDVEAELFRIGQEAITNAVRHAGAGHVLVSLQFHDAGARLEVTDDGAGFLYDPQAVPDDHYGLITMRERAEELHATLTITSAPGRGTTVEVAVPAEQPYRRAIPA